jgi:small subunit ribosomal protein S20
MANRRAAVKSLRVDKKRHARNMRIKNELKKTIKNFQALVAEKKSEEARKVLLKVSSLLDKAAKKNVIHPNTASRRKSRLSRKVLKAA